MSVLLSMFFNRIENKAKTKRERKRESERVRKRECDRKKNTQSEWSDFELDIDWKWNSNENEKEKWANINYENMLVKTKKKSHLMVWQTKQRKNFKFTCADCLLHFIRYSLLTCILNVLIVILST